MNLEPIEPEHAVELYLDDRREELADLTYSTHRSRLSHFIQWCDERDIDNLNELTGRLLYEYRVWRRRDGNLSKPSLKSQMDTLRVFIRWLESIEGVAPDLHMKVRAVTLTAEENSRDVLLTPAEADGILEYLGKYSYASLQHVTIALLWHTMLRRGSARALDLSDYDAEEQSIAVQHRPDSDTPLKNGHNGERLVALSDWMCDLLDDWIAMQRPNVEDEFGREPLLATTHGRIHQSTISTYVYRLSRPCVYSGACPHDRDIDSCEATGPDSASKCPSSVSSHAIRRGAITHHLNSNVPENVVGGRADVSQDVLEQHYDRRSDREKMEQRRKFLDSL
ncbi:site-specific integrase [Salinirubellus salinus]|uniref:Site-specific integrase n=1 Tax=Salinirubellus salinus TaxID=1364945 RepID=A0A9E7R1D7_9EURY|nr:site-specific integrase [Salinirubellus salinus]UWM53945.1 site-specific integrase [Salinirubellus salinus]